MNQPDIIKLGFKPDFKKLRSLDIPIEEISMTELEHNLDIPYREKEGTDDRNLTPREYMKNREKELHHTKVVEKADTQYPIDIYLKNNERIILDGVHRLVKLLLLGKEKIKVRKISLEMMNLIKK